MDGVKHALRLAAVATVSAFSMTAVAQTISASAEVARRASDSQNALALVKEGDAAYQKADYASAVKHYAQAVDRLPEQANVVSELRGAAIQRFAQAAVEQARVLARKGNYPEANRLLDEVDLLRPNDLRAAEMRGRIEDPIRTNPSATKEHTAKVDQVRRGLYEAEGFLNLGQFDRAELAYEDVIRIDPYNKAARRGMERVAFHKSSYAGAAYDQARAALLEEVSRAWESRKYENHNIPTFLEQAQPEGKLQIAATLEKLRTIILPVVDFEDATLQEVFDFFRAVTRQRDTLELDENLKGVDFVLQLGSSDNPVTQRILQSQLDIQLRNVTVEQALKVVTGMTKTQFRIDEFAVVITPLGSVDNTLITRTFRVPPDFLTRDSINSQSENEDPFADESERTGRLLAKRLSAREKLEALGVSFPEGANVSYIPSSSSLRVRNTVENLDYVARIVASAAEEEPVQVVIRTSIIDITQNDLEEIGYDWVLGQFGGSDLTLSGGSQGNGAAITDLLPGAPVTSGLRSGADITNIDGLDAAVARIPRASATGSSTSNTIFGGATTGTASLNLPPPPGAPSRSPGALSFRGVIGNGLAQAMLRGFDQKGGVDVLIRPEVITRSGQNAVVKSVREFSYPTEYEPPEIPNAIAGGTTVATPSTPTTFETTELGVTLEVLPQVSADRKYVDVAVTPFLREFEGFIDYGSPITGQTQSSAFTMGFGGFATSSAIGEITSNQILQPLIRSIKTTTSVTIADGHTIVIAGQMNQTHQLVHDKVPILGDIPFIGRFFQTRALDSQKRSLIILLNVELQDPSGKPYRNR